MKLLNAILCLCFGIFSMQAMWEWPEKKMSLYEALGYNFKDDVKKALQEGEDPNQIVNTVDKQTVLHDVAEKKGWTDIVQSLLEKGANINATTKDGIAPLHVAAAMDNKDTVKLLLEQPNIDRNKKVALGKSWGPSDQLQLFFSHEGFNGLTALEIAQKKGYQDIVNLFK